MKSRIVALLPAVLAALWAGIVSSATAAPVATIVEGESVLVRDATRLGVAEGVRFEPDDLIVTGARGALLRIEFDDGLMVTLGPGTRLWLAPKFRGGAPRSARLYLQSGSAKLSTRRDATELAAPVATPLLDLAAVGRDTVLSIAPTQAAVFAESGEPRIVERTPARNGATQPGAAVRLKGGEFYTRSGSAKSSVAPRPDAAFIGTLPRAFLDTLPPRASLFAARPVAPKPLGTFDYDDARPWIDAEAALRPAFVARWRSLASDASFRKPLAAELRGHPEWDRILYPEKYLPKPASGAASGYAAPR